MMSSHVAMSVAWPVGNYTRALGFRALCGYTRSSTSVSSPSVHRSLRATAAPASDYADSVERKLGPRRRSDTVLVSTINDADQGSADVTFKTPLAPYEKSKLLGSEGSMVARLKLKGIDGRAPPGVEPAA
ncbi:hypothetical protein ACSBR2_019861 [Camellia fascicularis]